MNYGKFGALCEFRFALHYAMLTFNNRAERDNGAQCHQPQRLCHAQPRLYRKAFIAPNYPNRFPYGP